MSFSRRRYYLLAVLTGLALLVFIPGVRTFCLRLPGRALVIPEQPVTSADAIVLTVDVYKSGALDAADLVHRGVATRVAVFSEVPDEPSREFQRRGVTYRHRESVSSDELSELGIRDVVMIPTPVTGSESEGEVLPAWCERNQVRSVLVVVNPDHSRRMRRILRRGMKGHTVALSIYPSRYSGLDPNAWWKTRSGTRDVIVEFEKLAFDVARHPFS
ncbi:MAG: hypothetical protein ACRD3E_02545 [Terriglobales bacterium]